MNSDLIDLSGMEVNRSLLEAQGGPLPKSWRGRPLHIEVGPEFRDGQTAVPTTGWRPLTGTEDGLVNDPKWGTVIAAPSDDGSGRWLLMHLSETEHGWTGWLPWTTTPRPAQEDRRRGLRLSWPQDLLRVTTSELREIQVTLSRENGDPLLWDSEDRLAAIGLVRHATTGEPLPFEPSYAFAGTNDWLPDGSMSTDLPITWLTTGLERLSPGQYQLTATLPSLNIRTQPIRLWLRPT